MALEVRVRKKFPGFELNVEFESHGDCTGILGESGCGKTMTLKCIAGIEKPDSGRIVLNGRVLFDSEKKINLPAQKRKTGYLFQNYALFPTMTVEENLRIVIKGKVKEHLIQEQIKRFQLEGLEKRYPSQLSGGQQQRAALARMLLCKPEIIILDEPFSALDGFIKSKVQLEVLELIREYQGDVLMVSHSRDEIFTFCHQMVLISGGESILTGKTREIFARPGKMEAARLTGCKNFSRIEKLDEYRIYARDWDMELHTNEKVSDEVSYVGIRGHYLMPVTAKEAIEGENIMKIEKAGYAETPFEKQYLFRNANNPKTERIWWMEKKDSFVSEEEGEFPQYMEFPKDNLMLLL